MLDRRSALFCAAASLLVPALTKETVAQVTAPALIEGRPFSSQALQDFARALAQRPFVATNNDVPEPFNTLNAETYAQIRLKPDLGLFAGENRGFVIEPLHRGFVYGRPIQLFLVEDGVIRRVAYDTGRFEFGSLRPPSTVGDIGFSGFRIKGDGVDGQQREIALLQGASFIRGRAREQSPGQMGRALALRVADPRGEEIPAFRAFWVERPSAAGPGLIVWGLIDSESATGIWRGTFRGGDVTVIDVEMTLFARSPLDNIGIGASAGTFLFGPNDRRGIDDVRPALHEIDGLQMLTGRGEWIWRPVQNPETLQASGFLDENPRGFGLLQRDRDPNAYLDDDTQLERRPSLWIEPIGDWGSGTVNLVEIPSDSDANDNIIAYWRPRATIPVGGEATFAYRQFWCWAPPDRPQGATVTATRVGRVPNQVRRRRFVIDFSGESLREMRNLADFKALASAAPGAILNLRWSMVDGRDLCRVTFDLDHGGDLIAELRVVLHGAGKPASETFLYRWTP